MHSSLCNPPTGNPPLQSVRVCPTSASAPTVHCVFHLPQSELVLSSSTPVNEKIIFAVHTIANLIAISACRFHGVHSILCFHSVRSASGNHTSTCRPSPSCAFYFCTSEQKSLCIPSISHHHRNQCLCVPVCAFHPPAIHRCNQCVCVQHPRQHPQFTVCSTCHNQNLCFLVLHQ